MRVKDEASLLDLLTKAVNAGELDEATADAIAEMRSVRTKGNPEIKLLALRLIVKRHTAMTIDGVIVDALSARAMLTVYDALKNPDNKTHFLGLDITKMGTVAWKMIK